MVKFVTSYSAANLLRNGNFDLLGTEDGAVVAAFWAATTTDATAEFLIDRPLEPGNSDRQVEVVLQTGGVARLTQNFLRTTSMTFPDGLAPETWRTVPGGYQNTAEVLLPPGRYSLGFSIKVTGGAVDIGLDSSVPLTGVEQGLSKTVSAFEDWQRFTLNFETADNLKDLSVVLSRVPGTELSTANIALISLAKGTYTNLPFTPDPITSCWPAGTIVMTLGDSCPPGFSELTDEGQSPLAEWVSNNSDVRARKGNFPRNAAGLTGTETHTKDDADFDPGLKDVLELPDTNNEETQSQNSPITFTNPSVDLPGDLNGEPAHKHTLSSAGTRPVSWAFRFCKRL